MQSCKQDYSKLQPQKGAMHVAVLEGNRFAPQRDDTWLLRTTCYVLRLEDERPAFRSVTRQFVLTEFGAGRGRFPTASRRTRGGGPEHSTGARCGQRSP